MHEFLALAEACAAAAGEFLLAGWSATRTVDTKTSATDVVTEMDTGSEALLVSMITAARPDDGLVGEEGGHRHGSTGYRWVIDPLDGTVNYLYGLPVWAVSVGLEHHGVPVLGVVHAPALRAQWVGVHTPEQSWATCNREPIHVSRRDDLAEALIATGFGYRADVRRGQGRAVAQILPIVRDIRRAGAAAVDLCWVADGRLDGYFESGTHTWDRCAGTAICRAAGATVGGMRPGDEAADAMTIAAAPGVFEALATAVREHTHVQD